MIRSLRQIAGEWSCTRLWVAGQSAPTEYVSGRASAGTEFADTMMEIEVDGSFVVTGGPAFTHTAKARAFIAGSLKGLEMQRGWSKDERLVELDAELNEKTDAGFDDIVYIAASSDAVLIAVRPDPSLTTNAHLTVLHFEPC
ncbi:MAG: hypothetical protein AAGI01_07760 [Myxococcota bacterium]